MPSCAAPSCPRRSASRSPRCDPRRSPSRSSRSPAGGRWANGSTPPPSVPDAATVAERRGEGARAAGVEPQPLGGGVAWVRRVSVDLGPFLDRAGAPGPVTPAQLIRLALGDPGPHTPRWDASDAAVLDRETLALPRSG